MVAYIKRKPKAKTTTFAKVTKARKTNYAVKKALTTPRPKNTNQLTKYKNYNAITTLARQVRSLQMKDYGSIQYTRQCLCRNNGTKDVKGQGVFMSGSPFLFELKNFYNQAPVFRGSMNNQHPTYIQDNKWLTLSEANAGAGGTPYAFDVTNDAVSTNQYMPLSANYSWHFKFQDLPAGADKIVQITVFRLKTNHNNSKIKTRLPEYLGQYANMCVEDPSDRNKFSPVYHQVLYQKNYHVKNHGDSTKDTERYINMKWSFSGKDGLVRLDSDEIENTPDLDLNEATSARQQSCAANFGHIIRPQDQLYVLVSTSNNDNTFDTEISCMRTLRWRDNNGVISK